MARGIYRWDGEKMVPVGGVYTSVERVEIITDSLPPGGMWHPATGTYVHSKARFREITRAAGCTEIGNEKQVDQRDWDIPGAHEDVVTVMERLRAR